MGTLLLRLDGPEAELVPVWRDGALLEERVRSRALPFVILEARVRLTPESRAYRAGWETLEQALATLRLVYGEPLAVEYDGDPEELAVLYRRDAGEPGMPEPV